MIEQMLIDSLVNYGMAGVFISYLIYDRHFIITGFRKDMKNLTTAINEWKEFAQQK